MKELQSYICGEWVAGDRGDRVLVNPATGEDLAVIRGFDADFEDCLEHAREGGRLLRQLTFRERGALLKGMSGVIREGREELIRLGIVNGGNIRQDAEMDVDGGSGTPHYYSKLAETLGDRTFLLDGEMIPLSRMDFQGQHIWLPFQGAAVLVDADNFPVWGACEKMVCALLAGMPVIVKPASATALGAHRMAELLVSSGILPKGAFQLLLDIDSLLDYLGDQDRVAFTGSSQTGEELADQLSGTGAGINFELDSLNAAVLGPDVSSPRGPYQLFLRDVFTSMTQKSGQVCRAIRRVMVPKDMMSQVCQDLSERLGQVVVGDPSAEGVSMGPLVSRARLRDVLEGIRILERESEVVFRQELPEQEAGFFCGPVLFRARSPEDSRAHSKEIFGPVATVMEYGGSVEGAVDLVARGKGGLVSCVYSDDLGFLREMLLGIGSRSGAFYPVTSGSDLNQTGPGTALPQLLHGGPGRAGGGCELGGLRGLQFYMNRVAVPGDMATVKALTQ